MIVPAHVLDEYPVVSFDVFDTALYRLSGIPKTTFYLIQARLRSSILVWEYPVLGDNFVYMRREAEHACRRERVKEEGTAEVTIDDIYDVFAEVAGVPLTVALQIRDMELVLEETQLRRNRRIHKVWEYCVQHQKRIIFTSDMYLPSTFIRHILEKEGYASPEVYVSCDYGVGKYDDGKIFEIVDCDLKDILHIDDNPQVVATLKASGVDAYCIEPEDTYNTYVYSDSPVSSIIKGVTQGLSGSDSEMIGASIFGPLVLGFLIWVYHNTADVDSVALFSRDGYLLYDLLSIYFPGRTYRYYQSSRMSALQASLYNFDLEKVHRNIAGRSPRPVSQLLKMYGILRPEMHVDTAKQHGFKSLQSTVTKANVKAFAMLLDDLYLQLQDSSLVALQGAQQHLADIIGTNVAFVDLGWTGSLQYSLSKVLNTSARTNIRGLYFHYWNFPNYSRTSLHDTYHAYMRDTGASAYVTKPLQQGGVEILENVLSDPGATVLRYGEDGPEQEEGYRHPQANVIESMHRGIRMFVDTAMTFLENTSSLISADWTAPFFRMVSFPTNIEADILGPIEHGDGAGTLSGNTEELASTTSSKPYWPTAAVLRKRNT